MLIQVRRFLLNTDNIVNITPVVDYELHAFFKIECFNGKDFEINDSVLRIWSEVTGGFIEHRQGFWPAEFDDKAVQKKFTDMVIPKITKTRDQVIEYWKGSQSKIPKID